jgi:hypothetical protein
MSDTGWTLLVAGPGEIVGYKAPSGSRILTTNPRMDSREVEVVSAEHLRVATEALEEIVDDLSVPSHPAPWATHALQVATMALAALPND